MDANKVDEDCLGLLQDKLDSEFILDVNGLHLLPKS